MLKMALTNLLPAWVTELYKCHMLDHLKVPSARHIALAYAHDPQPFTKSLAALHLLCPPLSERARHHQIQAPLQSSGPPSSSSLTGSCVPLSVCRYPDDYIVQSEMLGQVKAGLQANLKKSELGYLGSMGSPLWCRDGWEVVVGSSRCMCNTSFFLRKALSTIDCFCSFNIEES